MWKIVRTAVLAVMLTFGAVAPVQGITCGSTPGFCPNPSDWPVGTGGDF